jgi:hypothetical protein
MSWGVILPRRPAQRTSGQGNHGGGGDDREESGGHGAIILQVLELSSNLGCWCSHEVAGK